MKHRWLTRAAALAVAATLFDAAAQSSPPGPAAAASAPRAARPGPRALTPAELRESAANPLDEPPQGAVTPQISIPLGRTRAPPQNVAPRAPPRSGAASAPAIDDAAARCEAQRDPAERAACRDKLVSAARKR